MFKPSSSFYTLSSCLAIALHNKIAKEGKKPSNKYVKRTQQDYSKPFKLAVDQEIEHTGIGVCAVAHKYWIQRVTTVTTWLRKNGDFDVANKTSKQMETNKEKNC